MENHKVDAAVDRVIGRSTGQFHSHFLSQDDDLLSATKREDGRAEARVALLKFSFQIFC